MPRKKRNIGHFSMISMMDMLTGALGAVVLLFAIVPKQKLAVEPNGNFKIIHLNKDAVKGAVWGVLPDSIQKNFSIQIGDTVLVRIDTFQAMPGGEVVIASNDNSSYRNRYSDPGNGNGSSGQGSGTFKPPDITVEKGDTRCHIGVAASPGVCFDNNSPEDPDDDVFAFDMTVTGVNTGAAGWSATIGGRTVTGVYGQTKRVEGIKIGPTALALNVRDAQKAEGTASTSVQPPQPCSKLKGNPPISFIKGRLVVDCQWDDKLKDLDIILEKGGEKCYSQNTRTSFAEWPKRQKKEREKTQEYIKWESDPVPGRYNVYVHNWDKKQGPLKGRITVEIRDKSGRSSLFQKQLSDMFPNMAFPGKLVGSFEVAADGTATWSL